MRNLEIFKRMTDEVFKEISEAVPEEYGDGRHS